MNNKKNSQVNEEGIVSIVVTMIIMIVLSLIVTGFAQLARREQREALDRQLSTQANYAAESGINALRAALPYIENDSRTECNGEITFNNTDASNLFNETDLGNNSSYTCLLFDKKPKSLIYQNVNSDEAVVAPLSLQDSLGNPIPLNNLTISWKARDGSTTVKENNIVGVFPKATEWNNSIGMLRLDLIPIPDSGGISTEILDSSSTKSFLLQPQQNSGDTTKSYNEIVSGNVIGVKCNATANSGCTFTITGLTLQKYYLRMRSIYNTSSVTLNGNTVVGTETTSGFSGAQIEIDSTGKATDVLKRIKVRIEDPSSSVSANSSLTFPEYVFSSQESLCKRLKLAPGASTRDCDN
jgi:hypothetical protein